MFRRKESTDACAKEMQADLQTKPSGTGKASSGKQKAGKRKGRRAAKKQTFRLGDLVQAAVNPPKRAAMNRTFRKRRRRFERAASAVRLWIRYRNAKERVTIYRNP